MLISSIVLVCVNIVLNYVFIVVLSLGTTGAAIATGLSYFSAFLMHVGPLVRKKNPIHVFAGKFHLYILKNIVYNGSSEGVTSISTAITTFIFNVTFMKYYGESGVASFTIINYMAQMATLIMFGVSDGVSPLISFNFGAGEKNRVAKILRLSIIVNLVAGVISYAVIWFYSRNLIALFAGGDQMLIDLSYSGAKLYGLSFLLCGFNILISSYFTSLGRALESILVSASRGLVFVILGVVTLPLIFGEVGIWLAVPFADVITVFVCFFLLSRYHRHDISA